MGKLFSKANQNGSLRRAGKFFQSYELDEINKTFEQMAKDMSDQHKASGGESRTAHGIDKNTFQEYFPYPGVLRDQIFSVFDTNGDGFVDREEFMRGLAMCVKGSIHDKLRFCFSMFDLDRNGYIEPKELRQCLESTAFASFALLQAVAVETGELNEQDKVNTAEASETYGDAITDMVESCFRECDKNNDGVLSQEEFKRWMFTTPEIVQILYSVFELRNHAEVEAIQQEFAIAGQYIDEVEAGDERLAKAVRSRRKANERVGKLLDSNAALRKELRSLKREHEALKARKRELGVHGLGFLKK